MRSSWISKFLGKKKTTVSKHDGVSTTTTTASPSPPRHDAHTSPASNTNCPPSDLSTPLVTSESTSHQSSERLDLWARAYEILQDRDPELMEDYNKHLATLQDDMDPSKPVSVESIVNKLMDDREKMQWRISIMGKNIVFRQQLERLGKFLLWSDPLIKDALKVQQSAALAWSGVSLLLSVRKLLRTSMDRC